jgi:hypothetical protein
MSLQARLVIHLVGMALGAAFVGGLIALLAAWVSLPGPPAVITGSGAVTPVVQAGDLVSMRFEINRSRSCPAVIYGFLVDDEGRAIARFEPELGGYTRIGQTSALVTRPVPEGISGRVCYRHTRIDSCETRSYVVAGPDVCFDVIGTKG